jgi:hypothetical protein
MTNWPKCPKCGNDLTPTKAPAWMNSDQWDAVKAGDWFCKCHDNGRARSGVAHFWDREVVSKL